MTLYQRFFDAARLDLASAKDLTDSGRFQPALYHLQQAYEKCIKSYFIFKEMNISNTSEDAAYQRIRTLGHDTQESTIALLTDMADIERQACANRLPTITEPQQRQAIQNVITAITNYITSLDTLSQRLNLSANYINNVRNYSAYVNARYNYYQNSINEIITRQPDMTFLYIISCMANLYPCFYRMESITRYPLTEFAYDNLSLLSNQGESCQRLMEMLDDLIRLIADDLR
jgi:hypothetical protein